MVEASEAAGAASSYSRSRVLADLATLLDKWAPPVLEDPRADHHEALTAAALAIIDGLDDTNPS